MVVVVVVVVVHGGGGGGEDSEGFKKPTFIPSQARRSQKHAPNEPDPL